MNFNNKKLNQYGAGGSHEQNPFGGVPLNIGSNGKRNTVEEGESSYDFDDEKYIFSNRLKLSNSLLKEFNLPGSLRNGTFADASKVLDNKFKGRNDKVSLDTKRELLKRLSEQQEYEKMKLSASQNSRAYGGYVNKLEEGGAADAIAGEGAGLEDYLGGAQTAFKFANDIFGPTGIDTSGKVEQASDANVLGNTFNSTISGVAAGAKIGGPIGGAIGGVIGLGSGLIGGKKRQDDLNKARGNFDLKQAMEAGPSTYAFGGGVSDPKDPNTDKDPSTFDPLPMDPDPSLQNDKRISYMKRHNLSPQQLGGLEDQKDSDLAWKQKRDAFYADEFSKWRRGMTGHTPNRNFSQTAPEYASAWKDIKGRWFSENPREVNTIVRDYAANGPAGGSKMMGTPVFNAPPIRSDYAGLDDNDMAMGGRINKYDGLGDYPSYLTSKGTTGLGDYLSTPEINNPEAALQARAAKVNSGINVRPDIEALQPEKTMAGKAVDWLGQNYGSILRYAPVVGNLTDKIERTATQRGSRLDNTYQPQQFDEARLLNAVNQNNTNAAIKNASAGNLGAYMANLQGAGLNRGHAISNAMAQADNVNREEKRFAFQTGLDRDKTNVLLDRDFEQRKAQDEGAYQTAKSAKRAALFEDIGNIGKEETYKKIVKDMYGYTWDGRYVKDKSGKVVTGEDGKPITLLQAAAKAKSENK